MSKKLVDEKHSVEALKEMIAQRKPGEPVEKVLAVFCQRYGVSMAVCRSYYDELVKRGEIEEK
jgi:predicted solute-binding protein